ncbi:MAG: enoyl-CoA hydratase/isomerase family protein [Defluviimonas sp.]|uniref:3-hydroxyacyl-CoA dehydrogenase NAD-binding domain-containing protein n=1 Tax=Albidovulum sp. TaxID=1872424 RepID=UPI001D29E7BB|nr:enoyl-CoA hydratase/isomerase family protein [Paracoccaceae bacterium]MCC0064308.1 enoyl-CoA hydratase/isomerase family protein [Defluviimonas sp.]
MSGRVHSTVSDGIATIRMDNPPVNALSAGLRASLLEALVTAEADPAVRVVVLLANGHTWPAGAELREVGRPEVAPALWEVCDTMAAMTKPVVAGLRGTVLGAGLELALAATVRLAGAGTTLGMPDVALGLVPGAGGSQRLPRLIGAKPALGMLLGGLPMDVARAEEIGLVDVVADDEVAAVAERLASAHLQGLAEFPTEEDRRLRAAPGDWLRAIAEARKGLGTGRLPAPGRIVDCVEAALLLPEDEGFAFERAAYDELAPSPEAAALRHAHVAERRAQRNAALIRTRPREIERVGLIGGGDTGAAIAALLLGAGYAVTLVESDADALVGGLGRVAAHHESAVARGQLTKAGRDEQWGRLTGSIAIEELAAADMVIEAVPDDPALKQALFAELDGIAKGGAVLVSTTSCLDLNLLAAASKRSADVIGLHFFAPTASARVVEVVPGARTADDVTATGFALLARLRRIGVRSGVGEGHIGNRVMNALLTAMDFLLEDGATPAAVDRALTGYGFALGPYAAQDRIGLDVDWHRRQTHAQRRDPAGRSVEIADRLVERRHLGRKSGRGYYRYGEGTRGGVEDPDVLRLIEAERARKGIVPRPVGDGEIRRRALAAMANEGARIVAEGTAERPSDVDVVMMLGFGFPRWRGGPMQAADTEGLLGLRDDLRVYAREEPGFWAPAPLWDDLIKNGRRFDDLNQP